MKKAPRHYENDTQNPVGQKLSQSDCFEYEDESVSLAQIGDKIKVVSPPVLSKTQQRAANAVIAYLQKQYRIHDKDMNTPVTR